MLEQTFYDLAVQWRVSGWVGVCGKGGDWTAVAGRNRNRNPSFEWRSAFCQHIWLKAVTGVVRLHGAVLAARATRLFGARRVAFFWA